MFVQGLLMKSDDRLIAFMACKMMAAVLSSSKQVCTDSIASDFKIIVSSNCC